MKRKTYPPKMQPLVEERGHRLEQKKLRRFGSWRKPASLERETNVLFKGLKK